MNKSPLLVKSAIMDRIPFIREKTETLYKKYFSENRLKKVIESSNGLTETLTAYTLGSTYGVDFIFDSVDVSTSEEFDEKEWILLGNLLRAYKEVEELDLMHMYNCLYSSNENTITGYVVRGREYSFYSSSQYPITWWVEGGEESTLSPLGNYTPIKIEVPEDDKPGQIVKIYFKFFGHSVEQSCLLEGVYPHLTPMTGKLNRLIPKFLNIREYSDRLVEFFSGTLITKLSDHKLIAREESKKSGYSSQSIFNRDGFIGKEVAE